MARTKSPFRPRPILMQTCWDLRWRSKQFTQGVHFTAYEADRLEQALREVLDREEPQADPYSLTSNEV